MKLCESKSNAFPTHEWSTGEGEEASCLTEEAFRGERRVWNKGT